MSRIGKKPIELPKGVMLEVKDGIVSVQGPKGQLERPLLAGLELEMTDGQVVVKRLSDDKRSRSYHGLMRTLVANMVDGVSKGFEKKLEIVGIGYRSELKGTYACPVSGLFPSHRVPSS